MFLTDWYKNSDASPFDASFWYQSGPITRSLSNITDGFTECLFLGIQKLYDYLLNHLHVISLSD